LFPGPGRLARAAPALILLITVHMAGRAARSPTTFPRPRRKPLSAAPRTEGDSAVGPGCASSVALGPLSLSVCLSVFRPADHQSLSDSLCLPRVFCPLSLRDLSLSLCLSTRRLVFNFPCLSPELLQQQGLTSLLMGSVWGRYQAEPQLP
jgi:hypothetical protein